MVEQELITTAAKKGDFNEYNGLVPVLTKKKDEDYQLEGFRADITVESLIAVLEAGIEYNINHLVELTNSGFLGKIKNHMNAGRIAKGESGHPEGTLDAYFAACKVADENTSGNGLAIYRASIASCVEAAANAGRSAGACAKIKECISEPKVLILQPAPIREKISAYVTDWFATLDEDMQATYQSQHDKWLKACAGVVEAAEVADDF